MSRGINRVTLVGHLGAAPEVQSSATGTSFTRLSLATHESWRDRNTQVLHNRTEWHRVVLFDGLANLAGSYLSKGSQVYIEGALRTHKWRDKNGNDRYTTEIIATALELLGSTNPKASSLQQSSRGASPEPEPETGDDDIPF